MKPRILYALRTLGSAWCRWIGAHVRRSRSRLARYACMGSTMPCSRVEAMVSLGRGRKAKRVGDLASSYYLHNTDRHSGGAFPRVRGGCPVTSSNPKQRHCLRRVLADVDRTDAPSHSSSPSHDASDPQRLNKTLHSFDYRVSTAPQRDARAAAAADPWPLRPRRRSAG